jgi:cardiolipin synthase (CMP-forming)
LRVVPNLLSLSRLAAAPYLLWLLWNHSFHAALMVMFIAAWTDAFDGYLARRWNSSSRVGEVLDPIADKVLLTAAFLGLWLASAIPGWLTAIVLGRDLLILAAAGAALLVSKKPRRFPPSLWGKLSTIVQMSLVVIVTASIDGLIPLAIWTAATLTVVSFLHYTWRFAFVLSRA